MNRATMANYVVCFVAFCFVSMVTGTRITNATSQKYEKCLTNLQCGKGTTESVVLDNITYCCKEGQKLSVTSGLERVLMRMSQTMSRLFYQTVLKNTAPGFDISRDSKKSQSVSLDSSSSDSMNSFSDSESIELRTSRESMESRSVLDSQESSRSFDNVDIRDVWEYLQGIDSSDNGDRNKRGLSDGIEAFESKFLNAGDVPMGKRAEVGNIGVKENIFEDRIFSKTRNRRAIKNAEKWRLVSLRTRQQSNGEKPGAGKAPPKGVDNKGIEVSNTQTEVTGNGSKGNLTNITRPTGGTQVGPLPNAGDKQKPYLLCKCLPGN